jgi:predicted amidohydrolase
MKLTIIQTELNWENRDKNIQHFEKLIDSIIDKTDLIILPEMFTTGFTMDPKRSLHYFGLGHHWIATWLGRSE